MEFRFKTKIEAVRLRDAFMAWYRPQCDDEVLIPMIRTELPRHISKRFVLEIPAALTVKFAIWEALAGVSA